MYLAVSQEAALFCSYVCFVGLFFIDGLLKAFGGVIPDERLTKCHILSERRRHKVAKCGLQ